MVVFLNFKNRESNGQNTGDLFCSPASYFDFDFDFLHEDLSSYSPRAGDSFVLGGGGILMPWHVETCYPKLDGLGKRAVWGAGVNDHSTLKFEAPKILESFDLVGLRDNPLLHDFDFAPCSSCMNNIFDNSPKKAYTQRVGVYSHGETRALSRHEYPEINNIGLKIEEKIEFLSLFDVVVTNTYHGMYWATLLGKRVLLHRPFSNRHTSSPYSPGISKTRKELLENIDAVSELPKKESHRELNLARIQTLNFREKINELFG